MDKTRKSNESGDRPNESNHDYIWGSDQDQYLEEEHPSEISANEPNGDETPIVLDGEATKHFPEKPDLMERTKAALENLGTKINGI